MYRPGTKHSNADGLSRRNCRQCNLQEELTDQFNVAIVATSPTDIWLGSKSPDEIQAALQADLNLLAVASRLEKNTIPLHFPCKDWQHQLQTLWSPRHHLLLQNGIHYQQWRDLAGKGTNQRLQLVIPFQWVPNILTSFYDLAAAAAVHLGVKKTLAKVHERFYSVGQRKDVENWCQNCEQCATRKFRPRKPHTPLHTGMATQPMERIAMDILGPLPESTLTNIICYFLHIRKTHTTPYHPQSDVLIRHFNYTLLDMLSIAAAEDERSWDMQLPMLMFAYRSSVQEVTGSTPFSIMFGREACLPIDLQLNVAAGECCSDKPVEQLKSRVKKGPLTLG